MKKLKDILKTLTGKSDFKNELDNKLINQIKQHVCLQDGITVSENIDPTELSDVKKMCHEAGTPPIIKTDLWVI